MKRKVLLITMSVAIAAVTLHGAAGPASAQQQQQQKPNIIRHA